jgi:4-diphosphocytidyl-2-C-methyl-D-erythritol kinase
VSGASAAVAAQAKVNLFLHVLTRDASGYHQLETLFCRLALADDVRVRVGSGWSIDCTSADTGPAESNLAYRAAKVYSAERGWPADCAIEIEKRIPVGGGLGGGSADAGAVLRCLWALDPHPPPRSAILAWGAQLGADVPVLTVESPLVLAHGRGDRLLALRPLPPMAAMLYVPPTRVATREAYGWLAESRQSRPPTTTGMILDLGDLERWPSVVRLMGNDFSPIVGTHHPEIAEMTERLLTVRGARASLMSGSGSTVFCLFDGPIPDPWPVPTPAGGAFVATATADHVVEVRPIE